MIDFDISRRPGRPSEWTALVEAICSSTEPVESIWLECKTADWSAPSTGGVGNIARAILGMANRDSAKAAAFVGGSGLVLVGFNDKDKVIQPVEVLDPTDLENKLAPYLGTADGPRWQPRWIKVSGQSLLLIEVDPHGPGDPGFELRKGFSDFKTSQTFVREGSKTVPAEHAEMIRLAQRLTVATSKEALEVEVGFTVETPLSKVTLGSDEGEAFLARERERLLASIERAKGAPTARDAHAAAARRFDEVRETGGLFAAASALGGVLGQTEYHDEDRTPDAFRVEVDNYIEGARARLSAAFMLILQRVVPAPSFWISNLSERNFHDVEVTIRVEGDAMAQDRDSGDETDLRALLPKPPRPFGPYKTKSRGWLANIGGFDSAPYVPVLPDFRMGRRDIRNGGSFEVDFDRFGLRPAETLVPLESGLVILIPARRQEPVIVHWRATASNVNAVAEGTFELPFNGDTIDPLAVGLPDEDE